MKRSEKKAMLIRVVSEKATELQKRPQQIRMSTIEMLSRREIGMQTRTFMISVHEAYNELLIAVFLNHLDGCEPIVDILHKFGARMFGEFDKINNGRQMFVEIPMRLSEKDLLYVVEAIRAI